MCRYNVKPHIRVSLGFDVVPVPEVHTWVPNQATSIVRASGITTCTSTSSGSTPGILSNYFAVVVGQKYKISITGYKNSPGGAYIYVGRSDGGNLLWTGAALKENTLSNVSSVFTASTATIKLGILFSGSVTPGVSVTLHGATLSYEY